jgi:S1-C subfamily serine protease/pSer/pThr/pTyr-binding forkhead associated (FHA) protein
MAIELRIISGARAGETESFDKSVISIGRHPSSDFLLDIKKDLDVSRRHGEIRFTGSGYRLYDKDSTNGTYLNNAQLDPGGNMDLQNGDIIRFGAQGPSVKVLITGGSGEPAAADSSEESVIVRERGAKRALSQRLHETSSATHTPPAGSEATSYRPSWAEPSGQTTGETPITGESFETPAEAQKAVGENRQPTEERVAVAVKAQTRLLRLVIVGVVAVLSGLAAGIYLFAHRQTTTRDAEIQQLLAANEQTTRQFQTRLQGMNDTALTNSLQRRLDSMMVSARGATDEQSVAAAQKQLRANQDLQRRFNEMDLVAVRDANDPAITLIVSEIGGHQREASGFGVTAGGLIATNRHVVTDTAGRQATKLLVKFANTREWRHAHLVKVDDTGADLALIQIEEPGTYPAVTAIARSVDARVGTPIATLGFPLGTDTPMEGPGNNFAAKTTLTIGTVSKTMSDLLQIDAFASQGSSGSPVLDEHGHVIGVVFGGPPGAGGRIVYAVPADRIAALITSLK